MPIRRIVQGIGAATEPFRYRDSRHRLEAVDAIRSATGLSEETVHRSLDIEMNNYRTSELWSVLRRDLGDPFVLDEFRADKELGGLTRAFGPNLVAAVATGNVPGLAMLPIARSLLVKSPILLKVARGEPTFAARFLRALAEVDPEIADCATATYWESSDSDAFHNAFREADVVIVFGSSQAVESIRRYLKPEQRVIVHGHKFSGGVITRAYLEEEGAPRVVERLARDICSFDQHACIAPKVFMVEGDDFSIDCLGNALALELERIECVCPKGLHSAYEASSLAARRVAAIWEEAAGSGRIWSGQRLSYTVVRSAAVPPATTGGDRFIVLVPSDSARACVEKLEVHSEHLQNVVLGATDHEFPGLAEALAGLGACRVSPPGHGASPTLIWRHDGRPCVADLVRWCDIEGLHTHPAGTV
jgi:hypothetical protein